MPLKRHAQVIQGVERLAGAALAKADESYRRGVAEHFLDAIDKAKSFDGVRRRLSGATLRRMDTSEGEENMGDAMTQVGMVAMVASTPSDKGS